MDSSAMTAVAPEAAAADAKPDELHYHYEPLLAVEGTMQYMAVESIATVNFFQGVEISAMATALRKRLLLVCKANPWLLARVVRDKKRDKKHVLQRYPMPSELLTEENLNDIIVEMDCEKSKHVIGPDMKYEDLCKTVMKAKLSVDTGSKILNKDVAVSMFTLCKCSSEAGGDNTIALIVSLSHTVADGYTYFKVMS